MLENGVQVCYVFANKTVAVQELNTPTYLGVVPVDIKRLVYHAYLALGPHWIVAYVLHGAVPVGREIEKKCCTCSGNWRDTCAPCASRFKAFKIRAMG
jgi:hypothetical protein